jgi:Rho GTPase-activating protein 1
MRSALQAAAQLRSARGNNPTIQSVPPAETSHEYVPELAAAAASILYRSPIPSRGRSIYILNAAAFPDANEVDYDSLLSYVLARLPDENELIAGAEYEIVFFAGGQTDSATSEKKQGANTGWYLQAYHVLSRATRKKLQRLYIVHPRTWVRVLISIFGTIVSPKFRRKIVHVNSLTALAQHLPIENLLIPPSAYLQDRKVSPDIHVPEATGTRAFASRRPLPKSITTGQTRLPRVLRETTTFILLPHNIREEGLFRIPPHTTLIGVLKEAYDRGQKFIVWKEKGAVFAPPGIDVSLINEIRLEDTYGVHLAASLIKAWYRDLREPIFMESSYSFVREKFQDTHKAVTLEDLTDLLLPSSELSPLSATAREILSRHLLPMLSKVASHESNNKMNAENLAICFSMCLVCGSNQLEDGKMSMIIKRIVQAAIENWAALQKAMDTSADSFNSDIAGPKDHRDYEDPLEAEWPAKASYEDDAQSQSSHRIIMADGDASRTNSSDGTYAPPLPVRRARTTSTINDASNQQNGSSAQQPPPVPKRRPTATSTAPSRSVTDPPRYSTVFDADGISIHSPDSPIIITPADGFAPSRAEFLRNHQYGSDMKKVPPLPIIGTIDSQTPVSVPKRKAVPPPPPAASRQESTTPTESSAALLARMAAQQAATNLSQKLTINSSPTPPDVTVSPADDDSSAKASHLTTSTHSAPPISRRPSFPASASSTSSTPAPRPMEIHSLSKPVHGTTPPVVITHAAMFGNNEKLPNANNSQITPRHRAPSPGLLKRMASMDTINPQPFQTSPSQQDNNPPYSTSPSTLSPTPTSTPPLPQQSTFSPASQPQRSKSLTTPTQNSSALKPRSVINSLRKTSVEDLRRIYEERASTVGGLERVAADQRRRSVMADGTAT